MAMLEKKGYPGNASIVGAVAGPAFQHRPAASAPTLEASPTNLTPKPLYLTSGPKFFVEKTWEDLRLPWPDNRVNPIFFNKTNNLYILKLNNSGVYVGRGLTRSSIEGGR